MADALIVDDEEDICDVLTEEVEKLGFTVASAMTGEEAIRLTEANEWKLCVVDLKLSTAITGLEVIQAIRSRRPRAIVIAMTGYIDVGLKQETEKLGVSDYFLKPDDLRPKVFTQKIQALLSRPEISGQEKR